MRKWKDFFADRAWKNWDKSQWMIVILTGILLMVIAIPQGGRTQEKPEGEGGEKQDAAAFGQADYAKELEQKLADILSGMDGAGQVRVMVTLADFGESVVEKDRSAETTKQQQAGDGTSRTESGRLKSEEAVYLEEGSGKMPFVGKELSPKVAGVLVAAEGGADIQVRKNISEAVMALFQIDMNRIKVVKMKNMQEEGY